jgi:hypothetical protein
MSQHTIEIHRMADGRLKALAWRNWYSERYAEEARQHHRFQFRNGIIHVLAFNCEVARDTAEIFIAKWFDGHFATYVFTTRQKAR